MSFRERIFRVIDEDARGYRPSRIFNGMIVFLIFLNVIAIIFESDDELAITYGSVFDQIELWSVLVFGLEYLLRLITADFIYKEKRGFRPFLRYVISPLAVIDLLAILPSLVIIAAPYIAPLAPYLDFRIIRLLRTMRLLRIFKITRYSSSLRLIVDVFKEKGRDLAVTIFITFILIVISSTLMYYVEHEAQEEQFPNILATFWWAVATLTTVGYGDVYPITAMGKLLSGVIALLGIGMVALPTGILSSAFVDRMDQRKKEENASKMEAETVKKQRLEDILNGRSIAQNVPYCAHCGKELGPDGKPLDGECGESG